METALTCLLEGYERIIAHREQQTSLRNQRHYNPKVQAVAIQRLPRAGFAAVRPGRRAYFFATKGELAHKTIGRFSEEQTIKCDRMNGLAGHRLMQYRGLPRRSSQDLTSCIGGGLGDHGLGTRAPMAMSNWSGW